MKYVWICCFFVDIFGLSCVVLKVMKITQKKEKCYAP